VALRLARQNPKKKAVNPKKKAVNLKKKAVETIKNDVLFYSFYSLL